MIDTVANSGVRYYNENDQKAIHHRQVHQFHQWPVVPIVFPISPAWRRVERVPVIEAIDLTPCLSIDCPNFALFFDFLHADHLSRFIEGCNQPYYRNNSARLLVHASLNLKKEINLQIDQRNRFIFSLNSQIKESL